MEYDAEALLLPETHHIRFSLPAYYCYRPDAPVVLKDRRRCSTSLEANLPTTYKQHLIEVQFNYVRLDLDSSSCSESARGVGLPHRLTFTNDSSWSE